MAINEVVWTADPHTLAKIEITRNYLNAWFPILSSWNGKILYYDGFCGPGEYKNGEKGSPIVALETALNHRHSGLKNSKILLAFTDSDKKRLEHLESLIQKYTLPNNIVAQCIHGSFEDVLTSRLDQLDAKNQKICPSFIFADPFGVKQIPFHLFKRYLENDQCEVLINFMYSAIERFRNQLPEIMDKLFGTNEWQEANTPGWTTKQREEFLVRLYEKQLNKVAKYTWTFRMVDKRNKTSYYLVYATNHISGLKKMKEAMWKVSPTGDYTFSDKFSGQINIFGSIADLTPLKEQILTHFHGKSASIEEVLNYVVTETNYLESHVKTRTLKPLEQEGRIKVISDRKRPWSYPKGTIIQF